MIMRRSKWRSQRTTTHNRRSKENWCCGSQACYGGSAEQRRSRAVQAKHLLQFRQRRQAHQDTQKVIRTMYRNAEATEDESQQYEDELTCGSDTGSPSASQSPDQYQGVTLSFVRLSNLPTYPLDRLSRYEATLWRQACQILFTLRCLSHSRPWKQLRLR